MSRRDYTPPTAGAASGNWPPAPVRPAELDALRDWLTDPGLSIKGKKVKGKRTDAPPPPADPLRPLLRLLAPGRYRLSVALPGWRELPITDPRPGTTANWYWPVDGDAWSSPTRGRRATGPRSTLTVPGSPPVSGRQP